MLKQTRAEEIPPEDPEFGCEECGDIITYYAKCKKCKEHLELEEFWCDGEDHYCQKCGQAMADEVAAEVAEKAKNAPLPGQGGLFDGLGEN